MNLKYNGIQVDKVLFGPKGIVVMWSSPIGFGEISLYSDENEKITIDAEYMTKEFIQNVFMKLIDKAKIK